MITLAKKRKIWYERVFQKELGEGWLEIYKTHPPSDNMGEFFLAYRKWRARKVAQIYSGLTKGGVLAIKNALARGQFDALEMLRIAQSKSSTPLLYPK